MYSGPPFSLKTCVVIDLSQSIFMLGQYLWSLCGVYGEYSMYGVCMEGMACLSVMHPIIPCVNLNCQRDYSDALLKLLLDAVCLDIWLKVKIIFCVSKIHHRHRHQYKCYQARWFPRF